jgi:hypothetical protein
MAEQTTRAARRDGWVALGLVVSAVAAAVSSFDGLRSLAVATGWSEWQAPLLPLTIDAFALSAIRIWLLGSVVSARARRLARAGAIGAVLLSLSGNGVWHLVSAGLVPVHWVVVLVVGAVPPVVLAVIVHLASVRSLAASEDGRAVLRDVPAVPEDGTGTSGTVPSPGSTVPEPDRTVAQPERTETEPAKAVPGTASLAPAMRRYATEDELLAAARAVDARYRAEYGRPVTRDALRRELRVGGQRATVVLRRLREEEARLPEAGQRG